MGAWGYVALRLRDVLAGRGIPLRYEGRPLRASTAEGSPDVHAAEQARIVETAFGGERPARIETRETQDVS